MKVLIDIDLLFEVRFLILSIARKHRFIEEKAISDFKEKSVLETLNLLGASEDLSIVSQLFKTVRFKPEGYYLYLKYKDQGIDVFSFIEPFIFQDILEGNEINDLSLVSSVTGDYEAILSTVSNEKITPTSLIPVTGVFPFQYSYSPPPWKTRFVLPDPIQFSGTIEKGFGRGSKDLGFPTANVASPSLPVFPGVYSGVVTLDSVSYKAAVSIGWCPFYNNQSISYEVYILHSFSESLVGKFITVQLCSYLRCESSFRSLSDLIKSIELDVSLVSSIVSL